MSDDSARRAFAGRRVVVTGCASGIGEQVSRILKTRGAEVIGLDLRHPTAPVHEFHAADLNDSDSIQRAAGAVGDPVDALFNVAGVSMAGAPGLTIGVNFVGTRELTESLLPRMRQGAGVVNTASIAASGYLTRRELVAGLLNTETRAEAQHWCDEHEDELGTGYVVSKDAVVWYTWPQRARPSGGAGD